MNITETLKDAILANLGPLKQAPKNWSKRNCPLCHTQGHGRDTRKRFGIQFNVDSVVLNCFNCGFSASYTDGEELSISFKVFLNQIHIDKNFIRQIEFEIFKQKNQISSIREGTDTSGNKESKLRSLFHKWQPLDLPEDSLSINQWLESGLDDAMFLKVVNYAISRKLYDLDKFYWSPITLHNMNQRIIIPYRYKDNNVGYTARLCYDLPDKSIPKYFQRCPTDFIYNIDSQQGWARKYVIVNEGVLDAWVTDGVSTLGDINQAKIDIINRLQQQVIVCPDRDKNGWGLVSAAIDNDWAVSYPKWDTGIKDAASASEKYGRLLTTHSIISSAVTGKEKIQLTWDIQQNERTRKRK